MLDIITDLGDSALLLPAFGVVLVALWTAGRRREALAWVSTLAVCIGLTVACKVGFRACGAEVPMLNIRSPSGHTALSATFYGGSALLLGAGRAAGGRIALGVAAGVLVLAIAVSRVLLHAHTGPEIVAGLLIGGTCVTVFRVQCFGLPAIGLRWRPVLAATILLAVLMHGRHLNAEELIARVAQHLRHSANICEPPASGAPSGT